MSSSHQDGDAVSKYVRKIKAIRKLESSAAGVDTDLSKDLLELENHYRKRFAPYYERRRQIISGEYEPTDEDSDFPLCGVEIPDTGELGVEGLKGVPGFWLIVFNNIPKIWSLIQRQDYSALAHLTDIRCKNNLQNGQLGFTLYFYFSPNEYFANKVLTKQYIITYGKKSADPFNCYGQELIDSLGCDINWKGQDLTLGVHKKKIIKRASFFNYFDPPMDIGDPNMKPYVLSYLMTDFELGRYFKERIIPHAVMYYTGEAVLREHFNLGNELALDLDDVFGYEDWPTNYDTKKHRCNVDSELMKERAEEQFNRSEKLLSEHLRNTYQTADDLKNSVAKIDNLAAKTSKPGDKVMHRELEMMMRNIKGAEVHTIAPKNTLKKLIEEGSEIKKIEIGDVKVEKQKRKRPTSIQDDTEARKMREELIELLKSHKQLNTKESRKHSGKKTGKDDEKLPRKQTDKEPRKEAKKPLKNRESKYKG